MMFPRQMPRIPAARDQSWRNRAACRGLNPSLFFPEKGDTKATQQPKAVCRGCTVRAECLDYALAINAEGGIWGGTSQNERDEIRKQRRQRGAA